VHGGTDVLLVMWVIAQESSRVWSDGCPRLLVIVPELARVYYRTDVLPVMWVFVLEFARVYYRTDVLPVMWVFVLEFARVQGWRCWSDGCPSLWVVRVLVQASYGMVMAVSGTSWLSWE
jgi:hypothetical protein